MSAPPNTPAAEQAQQPEAPRPQQQPQADAPQPQGLLDRIVSDTMIAQRDAIIINRAEFDQKQRMARMFASSGCFQDIDKDESGQWLPQEASIARAMVKIELGNSMGFSPAESMTGIDIIKGRIAVGASLRAARMQRAGYSWPQMILTNKGCWMPLCFNGEPMMVPKTDENGVPVIDGGKPVMVQVVVSFTETDAHALGLLDKRGSMYVKDPSSMYYARAATRAQRRYGPGVLGVDALDTYEARDIADADHGNHSQPTEAEKLNVQQRIDKAEERYEARTIKVAKPASGEQATQNKPADEPPTPTPDAAEEPKPLKPIIQLSSNELPDPFDGEEGARVRLLDGTLCQIVEGGWKKIAEQPAAKAPSMALPKRK